MFNKISKAGTGMYIVLILEGLMPLLGIELPAGTAASFIEAWGVIIGAILVVWGQLDRQDTTFGLMRK